ncbi:cobalt-precorrin-6A reductase [Gemmobacter aquarius]|uniref:Cobalt-precorrin-6A reductase n=1 Tax=Paragemmobacter aquarius TaxID=2169400 RepID=A0A2S0UJL5_9RHOB|nr:cobalt-precorrin-6A reductase [Gemmobacter aquarius]AWB47985.1 cobalt-precorrin-6A reductase [Gemmobacter aquarius]
MTRILLLGGTTEASLLARELAAKGTDAIFSYAGRTNAPITQPLPTRTGGFGGAQGLAHYLRAEAITHVIDATHPFAATMSTNAVTACAQTQTPLIAFERAPWTATPADRWTHVPDTEAAAHALPDEPARVFLAIGKQTLHAFASQPQHDYLLRLVDDPEAPLPLPHTTVILAKGPFDEAADTALLRDHRITHIVAKNAGGTGADAKLKAARSLHIPVILIDRPAIPPRRSAATVAEVMAWLADHPARLGV